MIHLEVGSKRVQGLTQPKTCESLRQKSESICHKQTGMFLLLFQEKKFFIKNNFRLWNFCFWGCKEATLSLYGTILLFYVEKSSDYADVDVSKLCRSVLPHPVRCPVKRGEGISHNRNRNFLCPNNLEIYESETRDVQVDGSLERAIKHTQKVI